MASGSGCEVQADRTGRKKRNASFMDLACRSNLVGFELQQVVLVEGEQFIGYVPYLRQGEHGGGKRVVAEDVVDHVGVSSEGILDSPGAA